MRRIYFDTEFYEDGNTIELISIGMVMEQEGKVKTFYAETLQSEFLAKQTPFLEENLLPGLKGGEYVKSNDDLANSIIKFVNPNPKFDDRSIEFWAYYASYDWVALCQIFGTMMDLPVGWPQYCHDLRQTLDHGMLQSIKQHDTFLAHNALNDAMWNYETHKMLRTLTNGAFRTYDGGRIR